MQYTHFSFYLFFLSRHKLSNFFIRQRFPLQWNQYKNGNFLIVEIIGVVYNIVGHRKHLSLTMYKCSAFIKHTKLEVKTHSLRWNQRWIYFPKLTHIGKTDDHGEIDGHFVASKLSTRLLCYSLTTKAEWVETNWADQQISYCDYTKAGKVES